MDSTEPSSGLLGTRLESGSSVAPATWSGWSATPNVTEDDQGPTGGRGGHRPPVGTWSSSVTFGVADQPLHVAGATLLPDSRRVPSNPELGSVLSMSVRT